MAKFIRKQPAFLTPGASVEKAALAVDAAEALREALTDAVDANVVDGQTVEFETNVSFDVDNIVDCADDGVEYRSLGAEIAEALGAELTDDGVPDAVVDLLEKLVGQVKDRVRKDLEALNLKTKAGEIMIEADAGAFLSALASTVENCVEFAKQNLHNVGRAALAKHDDEVRAANARIIQMPKPAPTPAPAAPAPTPAAPAPTPALAAPAAEDAPAPAKKPRAPRKAKAAPAAEAAPAAPPAASVKHPVDVAEALAVLADENATPEAIEAALALLA